ncbi:MAG: hypothetical protein FJ280_02720 [Planctomycetes bacterium]|nr:hypothetical protein [Planctomycetota bacterium]
MTVKTAVLVGLVGAIWSVALHLLPILNMEGILRFLYGNPFGRMLCTIPSLTLVVFFGVLLVKQKQETRE